MDANAVIEVLSIGVGLSMQDFGRSQWRRYGVPPGGVMDRFSAAHANELLGNRADAPVLEVLLQGARLRFLRPTWVALAGADLGCMMEPWTARKLQAGEVLEFRGGSTGLWAYLAVPGGFVVDEWFGSASVDTRNGIGDSLKSGSILCTSLRESKFSVDGVVRRISLPEIRREFGSAMVFELLPGPQFDMFSTAAKRQLTEADWQVSARSDRTGYRLDGPVLEVPDSIVSEPVLPGSFQVPGSGQPIVTQVDGPTVGGYAKIAVMRVVDLDWLAQCRPGTQLRFRWAD